MTIERAEPENIEIGLDDDVRHVGLSFYDVIHMMIHHVGTEDWQEAINKAIAVVRKEKPDEDPATVSVEIPTPSVSVPIAMLQDALERFNNTHDAEELRAAAKGAQPNFGGSMGDLLQALASQGAVVLKVGEDEEPGPQEPGKKAPKLH